MNHVMIDLETRGSRPGCAILSIGAVAFGPNYGNLGPEFYKVINTASCHEAGLTDDESTMAWWKSQSDEARAVVEQAEQSETPLKDGLAEFASWLGKLGHPKQLKVWGNGADFDNAIMACCYAAAKQPLPWEFWNNRCYRTIKGLAPAMKMKRMGTFHNALDDAKSQAVHLTQLIKVLKLSV